MGDTYVIPLNYDLHLEQNDVSKTIGVSALDDVDVDELCVLTVTAAHGAGITVYGDGSTVDIATSGTVPSNQTLTLYVIKLDFDVSDGIDTADVGCTGETASANFLQ